MHKMQRMLLAILTSFFTTTLFAQISVNIEISGIEKSMEDNVRLFLSIEQQKKYQLLNEGLLRRLHKKAPQEIAKALQPFGYYRPVIESQIKKIRQNKIPTSGWRVIPSTLACHYLLLNSISY